LLKLSGNKPKFAQITGGKLKFSQITGCEICHESPKPKKKITRTKTKNKITGWKIENGLYYRG